MGLKSVVLLNFGKYIFKRISDLLKTLEYENNEIVGKSFVIGSIEWKSPWLAVNLLFKCESDVKANEVHDFVSTRTYFQRKK